MGIQLGRWTGLLSLLAVAIAGAALATWSTASGQEDDPSDRPAPSIEGRFSVVSAAGGAVWALQPRGQLTLVGPGDLIAEGAWREAAEPGAFDASLVVPVTGQSLTVLGALSPDGQRVALHVRASEPRTPADGVAWPQESRLIGERVGMLGGEPIASTGPDECLRPSWDTSSVVDWDRCSIESSATAEPSIEP
jgi:hypothetical protein